MDVVAIGPVVKQVSDEFDLYWNHAASIPMANLSRQNTTPEEFAAKRAALIAHRETAGQSKYAKDVRHERICAAAPEPEHFVLLGSRHDRKRSTRTKCSPLPRRRRHISRPQLREVVDKTKIELFLVSPYFVPGKQGVELLAGVRQRGARVVVITNSLASTDGVPVHSKYKLYRKALLQAGVELYELKPTARRPARRRIGRACHGPAGSGSAGLHAKTFAFDRRIAFVGSYNLDPRSNRLNTEMGVLFDCPAFAKRLPIEDRAGSRSQHVSRRAGGKPPRMGDSRGQQGGPLSIPSPRPVLGSASRSPS